MPKNNNRYERKRKYQMKKLFLYNTKDRFPSIPRTNINQQCHLATVKPVDIYEKKNSSRKYRFWFRMWPREIIKKMNIDYSLLSKSQKKAIQLYLK